MTTSKPHTTIIQQRRKPSNSPSSSEDDIVDDSPDSSYERLPPLTHTDQPLPQASTSTIASTASVATYNSRDSDGEEPYNNEDDEDDDAVQDMEGDHPVKLLPSDAAIPSALPIYHLPPINDYPIRPTTPEFFSQLFPTMDRLTIRHDDLTPDGNMNLRIETPPQFLLPPDFFRKHADQDNASSKRSRVPKRPLAFQLFHLRMHDLARRDFSLRRYSRDSGREMCNSKRAFVVEGQQPPREEDDEDEKPHRHNMLTRPNTSGGSIQRTVSTAFRSVTTPFQRSSNSSSHFRRPGTSSNHQRSSSRSTSSSSSSWSSPSSPVFSTDKLSLAPSSTPSSRNADTLPKPVKKATETIKLEFSNYARVDVTRNQNAGDKKDKDAVEYGFEWWGHAYAWRRVVDENTGTVSYHLVRDGKGSPVAHIVPETRGLEEMRRDEEVGGWVPPCHIWISDKSVINAVTDVADIIMATGLITLVDDSIHTRWQVNPRHEPLRSYTGDGIANRHKGLLSNIFQRRRSEQYASRGKPLTTY